MSDGKFTMDINIKMQQIKINFAVQIKKNHAGFNT